MDPSTVIVVLAAHLVGTGALLHLIGRRMPPRCGIQPWATGMVLFGAVYVVRLVCGPDVHAVVAAVTDTVMIGAAMLFVVGLREFTGRDKLRRDRAAMALLLFAAIDLAASTFEGSTGRYTALNTGLGLLYAWLARNAALARRQVEPTLRRPLLVLASLMGGLALLTLARGVHIAVEGAGVAFRGLFAQLYYGYATPAAVLLAMSLLWMVFLRLNNQLAELATRDALTRVLNRVGLDDALRRHFGARSVVPLTLLAIDADHFKRINDTHGHPAGDQMLRALADTLIHHVRPNDLVARTGGEEFVVCWPGAEAATTLALAERLREAAAALEVHTGDGRAVVRCTVSIGISQPFTALADWPRAAAEADRALYAAKAAGRNRVVCG